VRCELALKTCVPQSRNQAGTGFLSATMTSDPQNSEVAREGKAFSAAATLRTGAMLLLFATAGVVETRRLSSLPALANSDIWWHLRTGIWMLENHGVPHSGLFSQSTDLPWSAPSWGYDVLLALGFRLLALRSIPVLLIVFRPMLALVTFLLGGGLRGRFWAAVALSALAQYILGGLQPGPNYCSVILLGVELHLLLESRSVAKRRTLLWLAPLFLVWANLDVQFVYGIALFGLFIVASLLQGFVSRFGGNGLPDAPAAFLKNAGLAAALSGIATLINPYGFHVYGVFWASTGGAASLYLPSFHAMGFRQPQDYALMLVTMGAFLALGLGRSRDAFKILLMIGSTALSFYAQRDAWVVALAAIAVIGEEIGAAAERTGASQKRWRFEALTACGLSAAVLALAVVLLIPRSQTVLLSKVAQSYPVAACDYIREHRLPQPLFNSYAWGGFVTWYLPEYPVAIDSRPGLYGDDFLVEYFKVANADVPYREFSAMNQAETLLFERSSLMGQALGSIAAFRVAYSDAVAVVLVKQ